MQVTLEKHPSFLGKGNRNLISKDGREDNHQISYLAQLHWHNAPHLALLEEFAMYANCYAFPKRSDIDWRSSNDPHNIFITRTNPEFAEDNGNQHCSNNRKHVGFLPFLPWFIVFTILYLSQTLSHYIYLLLPHCCHSIPTSFPPSRTSEICIITSQANNMFSCDVLPIREMLNTSRVVEICSVKTKTIREIPWI